MKVTPIYHTGKGLDAYYAARLLVFTKSTRMELSSSWEKITRMSNEELEKEIAYMATTIPSSWEFLDFTFLIEGISRATAQQVTRTRTATFAMQSQRVSDVSGSTFDAKSEPIKNAIRASLDNYKWLIDTGTPLEDARDILPMGVHCNLIAKYNLRTLVDLCIQRDSLRVQGPYRELVLELKRCVLEEWPWASPFFVPKNEIAAKLIEEVAVDLRKMEGKDGAMYNGLSGKLAKAADLIKKV